MKLFSSSPEKISSVKNSGKVYQYYVAIAANFGVLLMGCGFVHSSPVGPLLTDGSSSIHLTLNENSLFSSSSTIGAMIGGLVSGFCMKRGGRRGTMLICAVVSGVCWLILAAAVNLFMLLLGRTVQGVCWGILSVVIPTYVAEIADPSIRGKLGSFFIVGMQSGMMYILIAGLFLKNFRHLSLAGLPLSILYYILVHFSTESPVHLALGGREEEAKVAIRKLNGPSCDTSKELERLKELEPEKSENKSVGQVILSLRHPEGYKPILICLLLVFFHQMSGLNAIAFNLLQIFKNSGISLPPDLCTIFYSMFGIPASILSGIFLDRYGRKPLLIIGYFAMFATEALLPTFFYLKGLSNEWDAWAMENLWWMPIAGICGHNFSVCIGTGCVVWVIIGELFSPAYREISVSIVGCLNWGTAFLITFTLVPMEVHISLYAPYAIYSCSSLLAAVLVIFVLPETKGKTIEEITALFVDKKLTKGVESCRNISGQINPVFTDEYDRKLEISSV